MASINDLPIELYELIFKNNLSINDLFNCRLVNKKFKFATYECVNKLVINEFDEVNHDYWFYNNELMDDNYTISFKCSIEIRSKSIFNLDKCLKYLKINLNSNIEIGFKEFNDQLSNLNSLINLEYLEINSTYHQYNCKLNLNLRNLKYFKLSKLNFLYPCKLNTPQLKKIQFFQLNSENEQKILIESNSVRSIKHLITEDYEDDLKQFKNLKILELTDAINLNENLLSFFINLKQLKIDFSTSSEPKELKDCLIKILERSKKLNRIFTIYLNGVKIDTTNKLVEYESYDGNILKFQLNNYDLLNFNSPENKSLDYFNLNCFYDNLRNNLPCSFFNKYQNITNIYVSVYDENKSIDANDLNWFLNKLKCLKIIRITNVPLDQHFFNNLPITIRAINIKDYSGQSLYLNINFDFILKFDKLIYFEQAGWNVDLFDSAFKSFTNLKYLKNFAFSNKHRKLQIIKEEKSIFRFYFNGANCIRLDYDQLVKKYNELYRI